MLYSKITIAIEHVYNFAHYRCKIHLQGASFSKTFALTKILGPALDVHTNWFELRCALDTVLVRHGKKRVHTAKQKI